MTKVVCLLLLVGLTLAGCGKKEESTGASPSPSKPVAVSVDAPAPDAPPVEAPAAPVPDAPAPDAAAPQAPAVLPPFINTDAKPASSGSEGAAAAPKPVSPTAALAALNQSLRTYLSTHQQQLPGSVDELVGPGLMAAIPPAPAGSAYMIDPAKREVVLQKQ